MKTGQARFDATIRYIRSIGLSDLAQHIIETISIGKISQQRIAKELSLNSRDDRETIPDYTSNTRKRHALRSLLLCQRVYFSDLWAHFIGSNGVPYCYGFLPSNWKAISLAYWGVRSEYDIEEGIRTFIVTTHDINALSNAANQIPGRCTPTSLLTLTRSKPHFPGLLSCYGAVMTWLFKSGLVSHRWYMKHQGANNQSTLCEAFGPGQVIWDANRVFTASDSLPIVPRGYIVHFYVNNAMRWNGHWLISLGNGYACGCNNVTTSETLSTYSNNCSLNEQFLYGYKHPLRNQSGIFEKGIAEVINPVALPKRL